MDTKCYCARSSRRQGIQYSISGPRTWLLWKGIVLLSCIRLVCFFMLSFDDGRNFGAPEICSVEQLKQLRFRLWCIVQEAEYHTM